MKQNRFETFIISVLLVLTGVFMGYAWSYQHHAIKKGEPMKAVVVCKKDVVMEDGKTKAFTRGYSYDVEGFSVMNDDKEEHIVHLPGHEFFNEHFELRVY